MSDIKDDTQDPNLPGQPSDGATEDDWAAAMAEQSAHDQPTQASGLGAEDDWAAALAEQTASTTAQTTAAQPATAQVFQPLTSQSAEGDSDIDMIMDIPVQLSVELGRTRLTIKNIL